MYRVAISSAVPDLHRAARRPAHAVGERVRERTADAVGLTAAVLLVLLSAASGGGYFPDEVLGMAVGALVASALVVAVRGRLPRPTPRAAVATLALVLYAAWTGLSRAWSPVPDAATTDMERHLAYAAVLLLALVTIGSPAVARRLVLAVWGALVVVALAGVVSRLLPGTDLAENAPTGIAGYRLSWPIGYWNAQGAACAMAAVLSVALASDRRTPAGLRAVAAGVVPAIVLGLLLTVSRGGVVALAVGALVLVALSRKPLQTAAVLVACGIPTAATLAIAGARPAVVDDPAAAPGLADAGPPVLVLAVGLGLVAAGLAALALTGLRRLEDRARERARRRSAPAGPAGWAPVAIVGVVLAVLLLGLVTAGRFDGAATGGSVDARRFAETQRRAFLDATPGTEAGLARLGTAGGSRSDLYRVAWDGFRADPLVGEGAGAFPLRWLRERRTPQPVQNAHSLPLDVLASTGLIGLLLLGGTLGAVGVGAVRARRRPSVVSRSLAGGASATVATFLVSCAVDWTWQVGTLTAAALLLATPLLVDGRVRRPSAGDG